MYKSTNMFQLRFDRWFGMVHPDYTRTRHPPAATRVGTGTCPSGWFMLHGWLVELEAD